MRARSSPGLRQTSGLIVALHTNEPGYDSSESTCGPPPPGLYRQGRDLGAVVQRHSTWPRRSAKRAWPFDDTDSVAIVAYPAAGGPGDGFCARPLADADMNIMFERVATSDGSLSNFSLFHGLPYVNFETQDRGVTPVGLGDARSRLLAMIGIVMDRCAPIDGLALRPPVRESGPARPGKRRKRR